MADSRYVFNEKFLNEVFKMAFRKKDVLDICANSIKYSYIPNEAYKNVFKFMKESYLVNKLVPSFGSIYQTIQSRLDPKKVQPAMDALMAIEATPVVEMSVLLDKLNEFIKDNMSVEFFNDFSEKYRTGDRDGARRLLNERAEAISKFSVIGSMWEMDTVFSGFENRAEARSTADITSSGKYRAPFSILDLDYYTEGGIGATETACMMMRSGVGKTKFIRHVGVGCARRGIPVLHIQAEGSRESCLEGYDATWTACLLSDIRKGSIPYDKYNDLLSVAKAVRSKGGDIYVHSFEQFKSATMTDVRFIAHDLLKRIPEIGLIAIDYLELIDPSDGKKYSVDNERHRRLAVANDMKNLAVEVESRLLTVTQANDVPPKLFNDPDFVMTRHNTSECRSLINPFSFFFTGNQTFSEYDDGRMRIYIDKLRYNKGNKLIYISQNYDRDRFYDKRKTIEDNRKMYADMKGGDKIFDTALVKNLDGGYDIVSDDE